MIKISASKLTTFRDCRNQYASKYLQFRKPTRETTYAILGSGMHSAIQAAYENSFPYQAFDDEVNRRFQQIEHMPLMGYSRSEIRQKGYDWLDKFNYDRLSPQHIEKQFSFEHVTREFNEVLLGGFIDYIGGIADRPGEIGVLDFKSNKSPYSQVEVNENWQLSIYAYAHLRLYSKLPDFVGIYHIPTDTVTYADVGGLISLFKKVIDPTIDELIQFSGEFDTSTNLEKCRKCSIFCALKWDENGN
jgi:ATP-dependent helicase/DNAse subunit B